MQLADFNAQAKNRIGLYAFTSLNWENDQKLFSQVRIFVVKKLFFVKTVWQEGIYASLSLWWELYMQEIIKIEHFLNISGHTPRSGDPRAINFPWVWNVTKSHSPPLFDDIWLMANAYSIIWYFNFHASYLIKNTDHLDIHKEIRLTSFQVIERKIE